MVTTLDTRQLDEAPPRVPLAHGAGLGVVTMQPSGDGVAYVGRLLHHALADAGAAPWRLALDPATAGVVTRGEALRFAMRLAAGLATGRARWMLYNHVGIARAQLALPLPLRRPYGVFVHGVEVWYPELEPDRKRALRRARVRISNSHYTARRLAAVHPDIGRVVPCPLGLLPGEPDTRGADAALLERVRPASILIVGRMSAHERYKGHDELLECLPALRARVAGAQLVVVGRGDDRARLETKAAALGVAGDVLFTGYASDATVEALLRRAAAFAMPSRGEGFGLVYLQAMRAGLPCVASTDDAGRDVVVDGETGFLVAQDDREGLADRLARLLADAAMRRRLGEAGRRRYEAEFTYERFRDRLLPILADAFPFA